MAVTERGRKMFVFVLAVMIHNKVHPLWGRAGTWTSWSKGKRRALTSDCEDWIWIWKWNHVTHSLICTTLALSHVDGKFFCVAYEIILQNWWTHMYECKQEIKFLPSKQTGHLSPDRYAWTLNIFIRPMLISVKNGVVHLLHASILLIFSLLHQTAPQTWITIQKRMMTAIRQSRKPATMQFTARSVAERRIPTCTYLNVEEIHIT